MPSAATTVILPYRAAGVVLGSAAGPQTILSAPVDPATLATIMAAVSGSYAPLPVGRTPGYVATVDGTGNALIYVAAGTTVTGTINEAAI